MYAHLGVCTCYTGDSSGCGCRDASARAEGGCVRRFVQWGCWWAGHVCVAVSGCWLGDDDGDLYMYLP